MTTECTSCAAAITPQRRPLCGEILRCGDCNAEMEVVSVSPLRVEEAPQVQEDWGE
ncbi:MAG: lysine biosynthesis protein LysW [Planctomycetes bacterium]|nr:lysine biosynthesis protein LysW [Planctomycetota bacterium]